MRKLADLPIDRPVATLMLLVSCMVLGTAALFELPLGFMPIVKEPEVDVEANYPGGQPLEVLDRLVRPLEAEISTIPGITELTSRAQSGRGSLEVRFGWDEDPDLLRLEVREAVERARGELPREVRYVKVEGDVSTPASGAILQGRISAERDLSQSWPLLDRAIRQPLERVRGVARVDLYGVEPQEVRVQLDVPAMRRHGITVEEVVADLEANNLDLDLGALRAQRRLDVSVWSRFRDISALEQLQLRRGLQLREVARVTRAQPRLDYGRHLDRKFAVGIDVYKEPRANTVETVDRIKRRLDEIQEDPAVHGINFLIWQDAAEEILNSLRGLRDAGLIGGLLAVCVLLFFLRSWRTTLIVAMAIPFSLLVAAGGLYLLGQDLNVLTLLGLMLGVGMLVDNAVVVAENIYRLRAAGEPPLQAAREGTRQVLMAVVASTATTVIVWSWLLVTPTSTLTIYMGGVALAICLTVACSLLLSLTFIPLCAARIDEEVPQDHGRVLGFLLPRYRRVLQWTLAHRTWTLALLIALAASAVYPLSKLEKSGEPRMRQRAVRVNYTVQHAAQKEVLEGYVDTVEAWLAEHKADLGYENVYSWYSERMGSMSMIYLPPDRTDDASVDALRQKLRDDLPQIPGVKLSVGERMWDMRHGRGDGANLVHVTVHGEDPEALQELAIAIGRELKVLPDVIDVRTPEDDGQREVRVKLHLDAARRVGLDPDAVGRVIAFSFRGQTLRPYVAEEGELTFMVAPDARTARTDLAALYALPVPTPKGIVVPLATVADFEFATVPPSVRRQDRKTSARLGIEFDKAVTADEGQARVQAALEGYRFPPGTSWSWGRWGRDRDDVMQTMMRGVLLSLAVVILLMAALFESFSQPLAIVITLPLAFSGAFWALWGQGHELDAVAFIGVIILVGIVVNNGIVMVDHVNALRRDRSRVDALLDGCSDRLRPVLMTAVSTLVGLVPLGFTGPTVAGAYIDSLAIAVIGGLATSTVFTLIGLPVWYTYIEDLTALLLRLLPRHANRSVKRERATQPTALTES
ncbi:MAG: efflux RND transporter permease subunit [Planctomycetota bacterium]